MNRTFVIIYVGMLLALTAISIDTILPIIGLISADLQLIPAESQTVMTALMIAVGGGQLIFGPLADRFGRMVVTHLALGLYVAGSLLCATATDFAPLLAGRVLQGLAAAAGQIAARAILRDLYTGVELARALSGSTAVMAIAPLASPLLGYLIAATAGWQWTFTALLCYALIILVLARLGFRETLATPKYDAIKPAVLMRSCVQVLSHPQSMLFCALLAFSSMAMFSYVISGQYVYSKSFAVSGWLVPALHAILGFAVICGQMFNRKLILKFGTVLTTILALIVAMSAAILCLALANYSLLNAYIFGIYAAMMAMCMMINVSNGTALAIDPHGRIAGLAVSIVGALSFGGGAVGGGLIANLADGDAAAMLLYMIFCYVGALALGLWWLWHIRAATRVTVPVT